MTEQGTRGSRQPPRRRPDEVIAWLDRGPSLSEMREAYPVEWDAVQRELAAVVATGTTTALQEYATALARPSSASRAARRGRADLVSEQVRRRMAAAAIKQMSLAAATGVTAGKVRFGLVNGWVMQKLLFSQDLDRKPVSMPLFRALWPLVRQRRFLMPLVEPKGIYCFYSRQLIRELARLIGDRSCLEIAAGDGTLSRFLAAAGVRATATDDHSWSKSVRYPESVRRQDARAALTAEQPEVVVCSWPPAGNPFERWVFETESVELYVMIGSSHDFATGNWTAYRQQQAFSVVEDPALSRLVLPPELDSAVYVFTRRDATRPASP